MTAPTEPLSPSPHGTSSPRFHRQRSSLSFRCFSSLCGRSSLCGYEYDDIFCCFPGSKDASSFASPSPPKSDGNGTSVWHDRFRFISIRRKNNSSGFVSTTHSGWVEEDDLYTRPPRWKLFFRKLRAETRKMNCSKPSAPGFHYDPLSYAMNFDDTCWQQPQQQSGFPSSRMSGPILMEQPAFKSNEPIS